MSLEEFAWRAAVLASVNAVAMWGAIKLFDFGNERNKLAAAIPWSILISSVANAGSWIQSRDPFSLWIARIFYLCAFAIFYAALLKWYDLDAGQTLKVSVATAFVDVAAYITFTEVGVLPPLPSTALGVNSICV